MAFSYRKVGNELLVSDPIYGEIKVSHPFSDIVLTKEMLRLGDISQNGFSQYEFKGLENNDRLSHSIGAFHVMRIILDRLESILAHYNIIISSDDKEIALCSMLLHDIGHGPFSHSLELVTNYSHEKRTTDILLGDTEVGRKLVNLFGPKKVKQIASFIAEINDGDEIGKDSFTKLLHSLVSHQLDADRIDYLVRDSYYAGNNSSISLQKIIDSLNVVVNNDKEYELIIDKIGLSSIENVLIQRYQMYRDVYLSPISVLGDQLFKELLERYRKYSELHDLPLSPSFRILAVDHKVHNLDDFIKMKDSDFKSSFAILKENTMDEVTAYLSDFTRVNEYILFENDVSVEKIKKYLYEIFGNIDLSETLSITSVNIKNRLYKKEERLNIKYGNKILDLTECTNLIRPQELLRGTYTFFNPILLKKELHLSDEEFKKYEGDIIKMIEELNKKPEEFELKYIIDGNLPNEVLIDKILDLFTNNGYKIISRKQKENNDEYYDTRNLDLYAKGGSLRIRKTNVGNKVKFKGTYKMPLGNGEVYSSRTEIEENLENGSFEAFKEKMSQELENVNFDEILTRPILNSTTQRLDVVLEKNGVQVCLSLDNSIYTNHVLGDMHTIDKMIEIEAIGEINDRVILNEIHDFITANILGLSINKQSKYERGINKTATLSSGDSEKSKKLLIQRLSNIYN